MRFVRSATLVLTLATLVTPCARGVDVDVTTPAPFMFNKDGVLTGAPPTIVRSGDMLIFSIEAGEALIRQQRAEVAERLLNAVRGLGDFARFQNAEFRLGVAPARINVLRATYCSAAQVLLTAGADRADLVEQSLTLCTGGGAPDPSLVPTFTIAANPYAVVLTCLDRAAAEVTLPAPASATDGRFEFSGAPPAGCGEVQYDLRRASVISAAAAEWAASHAIPPSLLQTAPDVRRDWADLRPAAHRPLDAHKDLQTCLLTARTLPDAQRDNAIMACVTATDVATARDRLATASSEVEDQIRIVAGLVQRLVTAAHGQWVEQWLWLTSGRPTFHPLLADGRSAKDDELRQKKKRLAELEGQLAMVDKLAPAAKLDSAAALRESVVQLGQIRTERDQLAAEIPALTRSIADIDSARQRDTLLYRGALHVSYVADRPLTVMQHHDAKADFVAMSAPVQEIAENERLAVFTENADPALELRISQTVTAITTDRGRWVDELLPSRGLADPSVATASALDPDALGFIRSYRTLKAFVLLADEEIAVPATLVPAPRDPTPTLVTKVVPHDVPGPAPANVTYELKKREGNEDKKVASATYRLNRLYRARFRTGLIYSRLETNAVDLSGTEPKETVSKHGVDATFGVQTFLGSRRDIRTIGWSSPAFSIYSGLTTRNPTQNLLLGFGWEPFGGFTVTAGTHIGRSESLRDDPGGRPRTEDHWLGRRFYSITFDVDFLKQLFTLKPTI